MSPSGRASWSRRIDALRKEGKLQEALELARHAYGESPQSLPVKRSYAWAIYARAKAHVEAFFSSLRDRDIEATQRRQSAQTQLDFLLREYAESALPRRDLCLSLLLSQAARLRESPACLPKVLRWVGLEGLRDDDSRSAEGARGGLYPSLLEKLAERLARVALKSEDPQACQLALEWAEAASTRAAPLIHAEALLRHQLPLLRLSGRADEAMRYAQAQLWRDAGVADAWREWSLCEQASDPARALWLGVRAAYEARARLSARELTLWAEHLTAVALEAGEEQVALALGLWSLQQRARFGAPRHDDTYYLVQSLGGQEALELSLDEGLNSLDQRAVRLSDQALKASRTTERE